jgi:hypothetical protein
VVILYKVRVSAPSLLQTRKTITMKKFNNLLIMTFLTFGITGLEFQNLSLVENKKAYLMIVMGVVAIIARYFIERRAN